MKVILERRPTLVDLFWEEAASEAWKRTFSLCLLHNCDYSIDPDGTTVRVHASLFYQTNKRETPQ